MSRRSTQPGIAAAVLGVAVVASMGAVLTAPAMAAPVVAAAERQPVATAVDRKAVAQWLAGLSDVVEPSPASTPRHVQPAPFAPTRGWAALERVRIAELAIDLSHLPLPAAPVRPYLGDLSPPRS